MDDIESCMSLEHLDVDSFIEALREMHSELQEGIDSEPDYEGELDEPVATIENLLELLADVEDLSQVELHHGVAIQAHLLLFQIHLNEFMQAPEMEECGECELETVAVESKPKPKKAPAKKVAAKTAPAKKAPAKSAKKR